MSVEEAFDTGRPVPWLSEVAAEFADEPVEGLDNDPGVIARSLESAVDLFALPAITVSFDTTVAAEAVGCSLTEEGINGTIETVDDAFEVDIGAATASDRVQTRLDATKRLEDTCDAEVLGGVTGPALLAEQLLKGDSISTETREEAVFTAGEICVELTNAYLNAGADGVAILEPNGLEAPLYQEAIEPVVNTLGHYQSEGVVITDTLTQQDVRTAGSTGFNAITGGVQDPVKIKKTAQENGIQFGLGVPRERFKNGPEAIIDFRKNAPSDVSLSSQWTIPSGVSPETIHELMGSL